MLRRAIFSSPSGRPLEYGSIDHAIRVERDQIDEGFWLKHAAVGKPQSPDRQRRHLLHRRREACCDSGRRRSYFPCLPSRRQVHPC
jgi:hypothetical protein